MLVPSISSPYFCVPKPWWQRSRDCKNSINISNSQWQVKLPIQIQELYQEGVFILINFWVKVQKQNSHLCRPLILFGVKIMYIDTTTFKKYIDSTHIHICTYTLRLADFLQLKMHRFFKDWEYTLQGSSKKEQLTISRKHEHLCSWDYANTSKLRARQSKHSFVFYQESCWSERTIIHAQSKKRWK